MQIRLVEQLSRTINAFESQGRPRVPNLARPKWPISTFLRLALQARFISQSPHNNSQHEKMFHISLIAPNFTSKSRSGRTTYVTGSMSCKNLCTVSNHKNPMGPHQDA